MTQAAVTNPFQTALIAALAVLVGAIIGFLGNYVVLKRNLKKEISLKMAEYRLQWINNLGDEFSKFSSASLRYMMHYADETGDSALVAFQEQHRCKMKILLLMNNKDKDYSNLSDAMAKIIRASAGVYEGKEGGLSHTDAMMALEINFRDICNSILKREWRKLKANLREDTLEVSALKSETAQSNNI